MNIFSFIANFSTEEDCRHHFKGQRDLQRRICSKFNSTEHYWKQDKWSYECKKYNYRTSIRKGTVGKQNVVMMMESILLEDIETGKKEKQVRFFKVKVLDGYDEKEINKTIKESTGNQSIVFTDKSASYVDIADFVELYIMEKSSKETTQKILKWIYIDISNAKRNLLGNYYHKIKRKHFQLYFNEFIRKEYLEALLRGLFIYKLNRRYFGDKLFERLIIANIAGLGK